MDGHTLRVPAEELVAVDAAGIPEARSSVVDAGLHLRRPTDLADVRRRDVPLVRLLGGVDLPFLPDGSGRRVVAELSLPSTGRSLELWSDQPCLQVYTGNALTSTAPGHDGRLYRPGDGIALEPQWVPDAPNQSWTPTPILRPGSRYHSHTSWSFTQA
ncbi:hypothetical protein [Mobilicoccus caccae]|uniref:aldose epimerase family protein n=1 Tax=Mobilicoccus caccae TaxID=1859295 RepID=UPI0032AF2A97